MTAATPRSPDPARVPETGAWLRSADVAVTGDADSRFVLVDLANPSVPPRVLAGSAAAVWQALSVPRSADEIVQVVADRYTLATDEVHSDVTAFLSALRAERLVSVRADGEAREH